MRAVSYRITPEDDGKEVKTVLRRRLGLSTRGLARLKRTRSLCLCGAPVYVTARVRAGDVLTFWMEEEKQQDILPVAGPLDIRYEDEDLLIVHKPAPLACQTTPDQPTGALANWVAEHERGRGRFVFRPVNRLDKGTSGLMVIARHAHAHHLLMQQLHTPAFVRQYEAVAQGVLQPPEGVINLPIRKVEAASVRREVHPDGKRAVTAYWTERVCGDVCLLRLQLETGRTHQIRVHLAHLGHPIVGDFLYGTEDSRLPRRFALHACHVEVMQPMTGARLCLDAPLPDEVAALLRPGTPPTP
jgi:23S rRNA pseudouridine1911/1915/1917 synthase